MPRPSPRLPPVTRTLRMARELAAVCHREGRHERDRDGDFELRQILAAERKDLSLDFRLARVGAVADERLREDDLGDNDGPGDRILLWTHQGEADVRMAVDHRLDFLRVHL